MNESLNARPVLDPTAAMMNKDVDASRKTRRKRKISYLTLNNIHHVDYKETIILRRFMNDRAKILPARQSGNTAKQQRMITQAIKRAREMALLPFVVTEIVERKPYRGGESDVAAQNAPGAYGDRDRAAASTPGTDSTSPNEE